MEKKLLEIIKLSYSHSQSGAYVLILGEVDGKRRIPIIIGGYEAQTIALGIEKIHPTRPMTHDLIKNITDSFSINISEVVINKFKEGVFYSLLTCIKDEQVSYVDARTSDAVSIALRFGSPIYALESILDEAGIIMDDISDPDEDDEPLVTETTTSESEFSDYISSELEDLLQKAVEQEDYEQASLIRDELQRRKK